MKRRFYQQIQETMMDTTDTIDINMTPVMISILALGMEQTEFTLTPPQRGSRPQRLVNAGLIAPAGKWKYSITDLGRAAYQKIMADSAINLDDPNLLNAHTQDTQKDIVEGHLTKIRKLEITIDDMNALIDQRDTQIEILRRCVGEMEVKMVQLEKQANHTEGMLASQILDELCDLIPEVEAYRMARESAVKAISGLKARR